MLYVVQSCRAVQNGLEGTAVHVMLYLAGGGLYCTSVAVTVAAAFKAGKIQNNPFTQASTTGGAAIPPPSNIAGCIIYDFDIFCICFYRAAWNADAV